MSLIFGILVALLVSPAHSQPRDDRLRIGVFVPTEGNFALLGDQVREGLQIFTATAGRDSVDLLEEPDSCDAESGADAASAFAEANVDAVVGFLCLESLVAALPILSSNDIPVLSLGVRSAIVGEDTKRLGWSFFRMAPNERDEPEKIAEIIAKIWSGEPLALVDDGTVYGRELAESVRLALETKGIKPVYVDNYRPSLDKQFSLVRRIQKSGATHVFIGGDRQDAAIIARDAAEAELDLVFMGGDALNAPDGEVPLSDGVLAVMLPDPDRLATAQDLTKVFDRADMTPNGYRIPAYAAGQIVQAAHMATRTGAKSLVQAISSQPFDTVLGKITFDADGDMEPNPLKLMVWRDVEFVPANETGGAGN